jgi:hypothetical protein
LQRQLANHSRVRIDFDDDPTAIQISSPNPRLRVKIGALSCHQLLSAKRKSDGRTVTAYMESKANAPFLCLECNEEVVLKTGRHRVNHFAHANPIACQFAEGESDTARQFEKTGSIWQGTLGRSSGTGGKETASKFLTQISISIE